MDDVFKSVLPKPRCGRSGAIPDAKDQSARPSSAYRESRDLSLARNRRLPCCSTLVSARWHQRGRTKTSETLRPMLAGILGLGVLLGRWPPEACHASSKTGPHLLGRPHRSSVSGGSAAVNSHGGGTSKYEKVTIHVKRQLAR